MLLSPLPSIQVVTKPNCSAGNCTLGCLRFDIEQSMKSPASYSHLPHAYYCTLGVPPLMRISTHEGNRCPYCVEDDGFRAMNVLTNGRLICQNCGHIVFPDDSAFKCPCLKCVEINFSPKIRRLRRAGNRTRPKSQPIAARPEPPVLASPLRGFLHAVRVFLAALRSPRK
jgi:hypothetical protein